jgi:hypothetical protein
MIKRSPDARPWSVVAVVLALGPVGKGKLFILNCSAD